MSTNTNPLRKGAGPATSKNYKIEGLEFTARATINFSRYGYR